MDENENTPQEINPEIMPMIGHIGSPIHHTHSDHVILVAGSGLDMACMEAAKALRDAGKTVAIVDSPDRLAKTDLSKIDIPFPNKFNIEDMIIPSIVDFDTPNKLALLKRLKLSDEQIDYFKNAPAERLEGEKFEDYKTRRMLNKLIIKYRGQF